MKCETCKMKRACDELERMGKVPKHEKCRCYSPTKPITNADRIRAMSDEELAKYIAWLEDEQSCCKLELYDDVDRIAEVLDWLKAEAEP